VASSSARRSGWLIGSTEMPMPRRMRLVTWLAAAASSSGAGSTE